MRIHLILWCISNYYMYDFTTPINSKCCSVISISLKGVVRSPILGVRECWGVGICTKRKPTHDFSIPVNTNFCSVCYRLAVT